MRIGIDLDDVLTESLPAYLEAFTRCFGIRVPLEEAAWDLPKRFPEIPIQEWEGFFTDLEEGGFLDRRPLLPGAKAAMEALQQVGHRLYIVTGRLPRQEEVTRRWLKGHSLLSCFEGIFHKDGEFVTEHKKKAITALGLQVFVEDEPHVARALAELPLKVLLFDKPWNQGSLPSSVRRIHSWPEALEAINGLDRCSPPPTGYR
ncbi:MAG: hypothetical protein HY347_12430 [candidate division NC10 bacterium]|nr:hypothetical protein [candidate division NC10 bacterium]